MWMTNKAITRIDDINLHFENYIPENAKIPQRNAWCFKYVQ